MSFLTDVLTKLSSREAELEASCEDLRCSVCLDCAANVLFEPCGHVNVCESCCQRLAQCPICRAKVVRRRKIFI